MDLGAITMEGFVCSENGKSSDVSNPETNTQKKSHGSGFLKPERSVSGEDNWVVGNKIARTDDYFTVPNPKTTTMLHQKGVNLPGSDSVSTADGGQYMLCFSSPKAEVPFLSSNGGDRTTQSNSFSFYQQPPAYSRNSGYGSLMNGARGPFTPSQWMELEHQALIYKFISANAPVPPSLLIPIKKALNAFMYSGMSNSGSYTPNSYGWGSFHLGFAGGTDPEPGRCRRTDGKKWRCARDAVPDQKYCERHLNRGRHRSRKPVEGQTGRSAAATTTTTTTTNVVVPPPPIPSSSIATNSTSSEPHGLSMISPAMELKPKDPSFSDFGLVFSDTFLNPTPKTSYMNSGTSNSFLGFNNQEQKPDGPKSDWTQLSMSIPISSPPPPEERVNLSPLRLSQEYDPIEMGLGQKSWVPISWGNSMGGPLGEVLNSTGGGAAVAGSKKLSPLMMSEEWHLSQYQLGTSPTGVLQKTFVSLSNSSSGSSPPRGAALEAASLSYDVMQ